MPTEAYANIRAFIVTPFETKKDAKGNEIDFDQVRTTLIEPALKELGIKGGTTGMVIRSGSIHTTMFQQLLTADLVVAEVSIHNANVFYELGIRHALRPKRTFMLRGADKDGAKNDKPPFDIQGLRYLRYDRDNPSASLAALVAGLRDTLDDPEEDSPVFRTLPALKEQDRSHFQPVPREFAEEVEMALVAGYRGDLTMLALETRGFEWWAGGLRLVGNAELKLKDFEGAQRTWEEILDVYPNDKEANTILGTVYQRLGENAADEARAKQMLLLSDQALDHVITNADAAADERAEAFALQGRNAKTRWLQDWRKYGDAERREQALRSPYLEAAYDACAKGFKDDLNHYYSGLNALAMLSVMTKLAQDSPDVWTSMFDDETQAPAKLATLIKEFSLLAPAVEVSARAAEDRLQREANLAKDSKIRNDKLDKRMWASVSLADHCFLTSKRPERVRDEYHKRLTGVPPFVRDAASRQIRLYRELGLFAENVAAALDSIGLSESETAQQEQPLVILFTGHRVDERDREKKGLSKRFPPDQVNVAKAAIRKAIEEELAGAGGKAVGIAGGASGGDILFHEVCQELNIPTQLFLALPREEYIRQSVQPSGDEWINRFNALYKQNKNKREQSWSTDLPAWLRGKEDGYSIWQRNNLWTLSNAIALDRAGGGTNVVLIALWDKEARQDGPGGTLDMIQQAEKRGARKRILWTKELFGLVEPKVS